MKSGPNLFGSSLTAMDVLSKIADNLIGAKTNIMNTQDSPNGLASNVGTLNMTIDMMISTLESARTLRAPEKGTSLDSLIESLKALQPLLATLIQCSGGTFTKLCDQGPFAFFYALYGTDMATMKTLAVIRGYLGCTYDSQQSGSRSYESLYQ